MNTDWYYNGYSDKGYIFSDEILSRYALSLSTKPFVILTGISGTGKSKISQLFDIPPLAARAPSPSPSSSASTKNISFKVTSGLISGDSRANFDQADASRILSKEQYAELEEDRKELLKEGSSNNFPHSYEITIDTSAYSDKQSEIKLIVYGQRASSLLLRIRSKSRKGVKPAWNSQTYFKEHHNIGDIIEIEKVSEGRFKIVSVNDKTVVSQSKESRLQQQSNLETKCFIPVKSNWVDSTELFGYYNQLTEEYQVTKLLRFILQASENPETPHFLILDEMNLSKVEHYFSDFLSCLESRYQDDKGIVQEKITLHGGESLLKTNDSIYDEIPSEIELPLNLYVTGTVNIDDSTHMFSPKVLDRANVIEFNEVNLSPDLNSGMRLAEFPDFHSFTPSSMKQFENLDADVKDAITSILNVLKEDNMHFGFRTISEISGYIVNTKKYVGDTAYNRFAALDIQILQKILPKFSGTAAKLEAPLKKLICTLSGASPDRRMSLDDIRQVDVKTTKFPRSLARLKRMYLIVTSQGFVSFIE